MTGTVADTSRRLFVAVDAVELIAVGRTVSSAVEIAALPGSPWLSDC